MAAQNKVPNLSPFGQILKFVVDILGKFQNNEVAQNATNSLKPLLENSTLQDECENAVNDHQYKELIKLLQSRPFTLSPEAEEISRRLIQEANNEGGNSTNKLG